MCAGSGATQCHAHCAAYGGGGKRRRGALPWRLAIPSPVCMQAACWPTHGCPALPVFGTPMPPTCCASCTDATVMLPVANVVELGLWPSVEQVEFEPRAWAFIHRWTGKKACTMPNGQKVEFVTAGGRTTAYVPTVQKLKGVCKLAWDGLKRRCPTCALVWCATIRLACCRLSDLNRRVQLRRHCKVRWHGNEPWPCQPFLHALMLNLIPNQCMAIGQVAAAAVSPRQRSQQRPRPRRVPKVGVWVL